MARNVFYSFHYKPDCIRAAQVRSMGVVEGNKPASDNDWESVTRGGDSAIQRWVNQQLDGKSCAVVLIGANTAGRKWINYEIEQAWNGQKGVFGVYIHNLRDFDQKQSAKGSNPFDFVKTGGRAYSSIVKVYDPPHNDSKQVYDYIRSNFAKWIEEAILIRGRY